MAARQDIAREAIDHAPGTRAGADEADPIVMEIVRGALRAIQGEMEALIERTAMSPFIREKKDFHAALFAEDGALIAGKTLQSSGDIISPILARYPAHEMRPGDIYWYNDCYESGGAVSHTPDQVFVAPVFAEGQLVAFTHAWAHFNDIGGMRAGSLSPDCTEIFQEGIIVPTVRVARDWQLNDDLLRIFFRNSRFPGMVQGDTRAAIAAIRLGERRLSEMFDRFGVEPMRGAFRELIRRTAETTRRRFRELVPPGEYRFTETVDSDGQGHGPLHLRYRLGVTPERVELDLTESDDQVPGPVNYLIHPYIPRMVLMAYLMQDVRGFSSNAGGVAVIDDVKLREGSILKPRFPAPLGLRGVTMMRNISGLLGLMNVATGGRANAAHSAYVIWYVRGRDDDGELYLMSDGVGVGYGARPTADGHDAIYLVAQENYPAEFIDSVFPVRVRRYAINRDTGGPGRWRGGCGIVREVEVLSEEGLVSVRIDAVDFPPWGVAGGHAARPGGCVINPGRPDEREVAPLSDGNKVRRGDIIRITTGGGGGWGHPFDREPERVLADVRGGFVSRESAEADYGVVLTPDGRAVDAAATERRRRDRPAAKLFHRDGYHDVLA